MYIKSVKVIYPDDTYDIFKNVTSVDMESLGINGLVHAVITQYILANNNYTQEIRNDIHACASIVVMDDKDETV